jgi:hypothetical protein
MRLRPFTISFTPGCLGVVVGLGIGLMTPAGARADDATAQCIASSERGLDLRKQEKLLEARKVLATCATTKCPDEIRTVCEQRITEINGVLPAIAFDVKDAAGNDEPDVKESIDGVTVAAQLGGRAAPIDPGPHVFTFEVPGQAPVEKKLIVSEGDRDRREKIVIGAPAQGGQAAQGAQATAAPTVVAPGGAAPAPSNASTQTSTQKSVGFVAGGAGVVGVALGAVFGIVASSKWSSAKSDCGPSCGANAPAQQEKSSAESAATISTVGFVAGGVLLAAGLTLFLTAPPETKATTTGALRVTPAVGPGEAALFLRGGF